MKKKWFFVILIILIIAVVLTIVFINLFREKDTKAVADKVYSVTQEGYLNQDNKDNKEIDEFLLLMSSTDVSSNLTEEDIREIKNYSNAYVAFERIGEFFNRQIAFTVYTDVYKNERKPIQDELQNAQNAAQAMADYIRSQKQPTGGEATWTARMWNSCKGNLESMVDNTISAFTRLGRVYSSCVSSKIMNNDLTDAIFKVLEYEYKQLKENVKLNETCGSDFNDFTEVYLDKEDEYYILNFQYDSVTQLKSKDVKEKMTESIYWNDFLIGQIRSSTSVNVVDLSWEVAV